MSCARSTYNKEFYHNDIRIIARSTNLLKLLAIKKHKFYKHHSLIELFNIPSEALHTVDIFSQDIPFRRVGLSDLQCFPG